MMSTVYGFSFLVPVSLYNITFIKKNLNVATVGLILVNTCDFLLGLGCTWIEKWWYCSATCRAAFLVKGKSYFYCIFLFSFY
jgi:hypothetical protein